MHLGSCITFRPSTPLMWAWVPKCGELRLSDNHLFWNTIIPGEDWGKHVLSSEFIYPKGPHCYSFFKTVCIRFPYILFNYILFNTYYGLSFMKDVSSNHLGARGCQWMCDMLQNNVTLLKINLSDNDFSDKDTVFLLDALKVQKQRNRLICIFTSNGKR